MTRLLRRRGPLVALTAAALTLGLGLGQAFRDTAPPSLWIEAPARLAAGAPLELRVSADEPVVYRVDYAGETVERVEQDLVLELTARAGVRTLRIEARDGADNRTVETRQVEGVEIARARFGLPDELRPGAPFTATLRFAPSGAEAREPRLSVDGRPTPLRPDEAGWYALAAVPLGTEPGALTVRADWLDGLGRPAGAETEVAHGPLDREVEELRIPPSTLAVITPEGREEEAAALAAARADPGDPPRWSAPFVLPIEGRGTSGFARPRRYAPGGPVSFHLGEDIAAPTGTEIRATNDGLVVLAGQYPIKGGLTVIDHGAGVTSRYYHQSRILVAAGASVERGQVIGEVGSTGLSTGPHLHWEMRIDEQPTDPLAWVDRVRP